jgi:hypothetical protein
MSSHGKEIEKCMKSTKSGEKMLQYLKSIIWAVVEKVGNSSSISCKWWLQLELGDRQA